MGTAAPDAEPEPLAAVVSPSHDDYAFVSARRPPTFSISCQKSKQNKSKKKNTKNRYSGTKMKKVYNKKLTTAWRASAIARASSCPNLNQKYFMKFLIDFTTSEEESPRSEGPSKLFLPPRLVKCEQPTFPRILLKFVAQRESAEVHSAANKLREL